MKRYSGIALGIIYIVLFYTQLWVNPAKEKQVIVWDVTSYYGYLPALFIHHDLSLNFTESDKKGYADRMEFWPEMAPNGAKLIKMTMGMAFMYAPFFLIAHVLASILNFSANGFSQPYHFMVGIACLFYVFVGLWYLQKILLRYFSDQISACTLLVIALGTNLFYYVTCEPGMSHPFSFALFAIFIYYSILWHHHHKFRYVVICGLAAGLITLIRPTNVTVFLLFALLNIDSISSAQEKCRLYYKYWPQVLSMVCISVLVCLPQLFYWHYITGNWFFYSYTKEKFFFSNPHIFYGLFSYRKGWFLYTPAMLVAVAGIFTLIRNNKNWLFPILIFLLLNLYIIYSWWCWWYGGSFGARPLIDYYPLLAIPLASFFTFISAKQKIYLLAISVLFICHNLFECFQYRHSAIHYDSMTKAAYWESFGTAHPSAKFFDLLQAPDAAKALEGKEEYSLSTGNEHVDN